MKLSICMMVKDEEKNLDRCLSSLEKIRREIDSELIIVDTGSSDRTVEIAKKYTDKVFFHKWNNDFSGMRNITISYASGEWVFIIDADEEVVEEDFLIDAFKRDLIKNFNTINIYIRSLKTNSKETSYSDAIINRIFRRDESFKYEGAIHEQAKSKGPILTINTKLYHYGYNSDDKKLMEYKFERTSSLLKGELEKDPKNIYYNYQLAISYAMYQKWNLAQKWILNAVKYMKEYKKKYKKTLNIEGDIYAQLGMCAIKLGNRSETIFEMIKIAEEYKKSIDFNFALANLYALEQNEDEAYKYFIRYMENISDYERGNILERHQFDKNETVSFKINILESIFILANKKKDKKNIYLKFKDTILKEENIKERLVELIIEYLLKIEEIEEIKRLYYGEFEKYSINIEKVIEYNININQEMRVTELFKGRNDKYEIFNEIRHIILNMQSKKIIEKKLLNDYLKIKENQVLDTKLFIMTLSIDDDFSKKIIENIKEIELILEVQKIKDSVQIKTIVDFLMRNIDIQKISILKRFKIIAEALLTMEIYFGEDISKGYIFENIILTISNSIVNLLESIDIKVWDIVEESILESYIIARGIDERIKSIKVCKLKEILKSYISKYKNIRENVVEELTESFYDYLDIESCIELEKEFLQVILEVEGKLKTYLFNRYCFISINQLVEKYGYELSEMKEYLDYKSEYYYWILMLEYIQSKEITRYRKLKELVKIKPAYKKYIKELINQDSEKINKIENEEMKLLKTVFIIKLNEISDLTQKEIYVEEYTNIFGIDTDIIEYIVKSKKSKVKAFEILFENMFNISSFDMIFRISNDLGFI